MDESYFIVDGDGPVFEPVTIQIICPVKFTMAGSEQIRAALVKVNPEIRSNAFREDRANSYSHLIITSSNPAVNLTSPLDKLPMSAGLTPYRGSIEDLIRTGEVITTELGPSSKIEIFRTAEEAWKLYNQIWG